MYEIDSNPVLQRCRFGSSNTNSAGSTLSPREMTWIICGPLSFVGRDAFRPRHLRHFCVKTLGLGEEDQMC
jgi:hypothetical protein